MVSTRQKNRGRRLGFWLLLALIIHAEGLLVVGVSLYFYAPRNADISALGQGESIEISTVDDETAQKLLAELDRLEDKAKEEQQKKEVEANKSPGQVVDLPRPAEEARPDDAKFAAEYDSKVAKETRRFGRFDQRSRQGDSTGEDEESRPAAAPAPKGALAMRAPEGAPSRPSPPAPEARPPVPETSGEQGPPVPSDPEGALDPGGATSAQPPIAAPAPSPPAGGPAVPPGSTGALVPSQQQLARAIGSGTQDHLKDIDEGDETSLNAKKWKFASFFNRVKAQVREHWRPADVYRRRDPTGSIYGNKDRYTLLRVQLKPDGSLANVVLETPSGVEFLDDEAIEAFKQAQPFPNPPPQLVDGSSGMIDFRFGFYFEISGAPRFKIFRYNSM
jgi:TonB family protein